MNAIKQALLALALLALSLGNTSARSAAVGNVTSRGPTGAATTLTWDCFNRLVTSVTGTTTFSAVYDGLGRRVETRNGSGPTIIYYYDPQVEFLELGRDAGVGYRIWDVYGPDRSGVYGGLQGTGGLEAVVIEGGSVNGVTNNYFGDALAPPGSTTRYPAVVGGYGAMPGSSAVNTALQPQWRGKFIDPTGFYWMGARYYEPTTGRFLSADPLGHSASMDLYSFANGDPVNGLDPDGRLGKNAIEDAYNGGPGGDLLRAGGNYLDSIAPNSRNTTLAFGESYVGGLLTEVGSVNLHGVVNSVGQYGSNVRSEYQQYGLGTASAYAATSWNVGAIESAAFNINPVTAQPVGSGLDRFELGLQGVAGTTAVVAPIDAAFNRLTTGGAQLSNADLVQQIATRARAWGDRQGLAQTGSVEGTLMHGYADRLLTRYQSMYGDRGLSTEVRYFQGQLWQPGMPIKGSLRLDVVEGSLSSPTAVFDYKFGGATLTPGRKLEIQTGAGLSPSVPITGVSP